MASHWLRFVSPPFSLLPTFALSLLLATLIPHSIAGDPKPPAAPGEQASTYEQPVDYSPGTRVRLSGVNVGVGVGVGFIGGPGWGPGWGGPGWYGPGWFGPGAWNAMWWDPWFASPFWSGWAMPMAWVHPGYWGGFGQTPRSGEIALRTPNKQDAVMIDGAFAGAAKDLKNFWLEPGVYQITVSDADGNAFEQKVYVLSGKTLRLNAKLSPPGEAEDEAAKPSANGTRNKATP